MQRLSVTKRLPRQPGTPRRNKPAANPQPANPESPWRRLGYDPARETDYDPAPTKASTAREFAPTDYLAYERRASRPLPPRHPSRAERDHPDWPAHRVV